MLMEFLEKALVMGGDSVEIEHKDSKEWITVFRYNVGFGIGCLDPDEAKPLFREIDELKKKKQATIRGATYRLVFSEYESFGEWVHRIHMRPLHRTATSRGRRSAHRA